MPAFLPRRRSILVALLLGTGVFCALTADNAAPAAPLLSKPLQPKHLDWSFEGPFGVYDRASLQRGFQVYKEDCSTCHALNQLTFRDLGPGGVGFSPAEVAAIAAGYKVPAEPHQKGKTGDASGAPLMRTATPADHFPRPFPNEQAMRAAMNGALPPDLQFSAVQEPSCGAPLALRRKLADAQHLSAPGPNTPRGPNTRRPSGAQHPSAPGARPSAPGVDIPRNTTRPRRNN